MRNGACCGIARVRHRCAQVKNRKLHEQFEELAAAAGGTRGGVFAGVNLFVNGFTIPSHLVRA